jgi:hypothetical protein
MSAPYLHPESSFSEVGLTPASDLIQTSRFSPETIEDVNKRGHSPKVSLTETWTSSPPSTQSASLKEKRSSLFNLEKSKATSKTTWIPDVICLLIGIGAIASIIGVLAHFNGRTLPAWPYSITLNTIIALLTALANGTLAVPLSNGISQMKWDHFKKDRPFLTDLDLFDQASRGPLGAFKLIARARGR